LTDVLAAKGVFNLLGFPRYRWDSPATYLKAGTLGIAKTAALCLAIQCLL
jgi:hypothetical protein